MSGKFSGKCPDLEKGEVALKISKSSMIVNLCVTLFLITIVTIYFQIKIMRVEDNFSNLSTKVLQVGNELSELAVRGISKRSTPMIVQQPLIDNLEDRGEVIQSVRLEGARSSQHIMQNGRIGPWTTCGDNNKLIDLEEGNIEIKVKRKGLYFIYAQIYYLVSGASNSFEILTYKKNETSKNHRTLAACSKSHGDEMLSDRITCYTGTAVVLNANDRLYLNQIEQNRVIDFNKGYSYFGIIKMKEEK